MYAPGVHAILRFCLALSFASEEDQFFLHSIADCLFSLFIPSISSVFPIHSCLFI